MIDNISLKLEEFRIGHIKNNTDIISYDIDLHSSCFSLLSSYWTTSLKSKYTLLSESDLTMEDPQSTPVTSFDITNYNITSGELGTITGIDFATAYGITGSMVSSFIINLNTITAILTSSISSISNIDTLTGVVTTPEVTISDGMMSLIKLNTVFLDNNDVLGYYNVNIDIILNAEGLGIDLKDLMLLEIAKQNKSLSKRINLCITDDLLYTKLKDSIIEQICIDILVDSEYSRRISLARALNSIMPSNIYISENHSNKDLIDTTVAIIKEIDNAKRVIALKGF